MSDTHERNYIMVLYGIFSAKKWCFYEVRDYVKTARFGSTILWICVFLIQRYMVVILKLKMLLLLYDNITAVFILVYCLLSCL